MNIIFFGKKIILDNIIMTHTSAAITVETNSDEKSFTFTLTPYQADSSTWSATSDVNAPYIMVLGPNNYKKKLTVPLYNSDNVPNGSNIGEINTQDKLSVSGLDYGVDYQFTFYCYNGSTVSATFATINTHLVLPTAAPILGTGTWLTPNLKVFMGIPDQRVIAMIVEAYNVKDGATDKRKEFSLSAAEISAIRSNGYHTFDLAVAGTWTLPATGDKIKIVATATDGNDYSAPAIETYDLIVKPTAPTGLTVVDYTESATVGGNSVTLQTLKLLKATVTVAQGQLFDKIEILAPDAYGKYTNVIKSVSYDAKKGTSYGDILLSVELGSVSKYAARIIKGDVASDDTQTSDYVIDKYIDPKPLLSAKRLESGHDAAHPASTHDLFELTHAAGITSYKKRYIDELQVKAGADSDFANINDTKLPTAYVAGKNGKWDVAADGSAKFRVYTTKLEHGESAEFQIAEDDLKGYFTELQQTIGGQTANAQNMNDAVIKTDAIKIEYPLIAPNDPSNVAMTALNAGVMVRWLRVDTAGTGGNTNNKATSFIVNLYGNQHYTLSETPLRTLEVKDEYALFNGLRNGQEYWASVHAKNDKDYSGVVRSTSGATPLASILGQLLTVDKTSFTDPSCNFTVSMQTSAVEIATISVQEIGVNGENIGSAVTEAVSSKTAGTYTISMDPNASTFGKKYFAIYATSSAVSAANGQPAVTASNTPFIFVSVETGKAPTIGSMTFAKHVSASGAKSTDVTVTINHHYSELTLAKIVAIPAAPTETNETHFSGPVISDMVKGLAVSNSATEYTYKCTVPYHIAKVDTDKEMASVLVANSLGNAQINNSV